MRAGRVCEGWKGRLQWCLGYALGVDQGGQPYGCRMLVDVVEAAWRTRCKGHELGIALAMSWPLPWPCPGHVRFCNATNPELMEGKEPRYFHGEG